MQAGSVEPTAQLESVKRGRTPVGTAPIVSTSSADSRGDSNLGVRVELASAVSVVSASSATVETRGERQRSGSHEAAPPSQHQESTQAASLQLSSEAQRLALIPADVLDAEEIAEVRAQVEEAQRKLNAEIEQQRAAAKDARTSAAAPEEAEVPNPEPAAPASSTAAEQVTVAQASNRADFAEALSQIESASGSNKEVTGSPERARSTPPAPPERDEQMSAPASTRAVRNEPERSKSMSALQGRSPFESSAPGATGQSLDIIVGDSAPSSRIPA